MGGELRAESSPGNTRFWFVLPVESAHTIEAASTYTATRSNGGGASGLVPNAASPRLAEWARSGRAEKQQRRRNWNSISSGNTNTNTCEGRKEGRRGSLPRYLPALLPSTLVHRLLPPSTCCCIPADPPDSRGAPGCAATDLSPSRAAPSNETTTANRARRLLSRARPPWSHVCGRRRHPSRRW